MGAEEIGPYEEIYRQASEAHDQLRYSSFLKDLRSRNFGDGLVADWIFLELEKILEEVKDWNPRDREVFFSSLLRHYSEKRSDFKPSAVPFERKLNVDELVAGNYDAKEMAARLLQVVARYERTVILPLLQQISYEIRSRYSGKYLFFIGRDFSSTYIYMQSKVPETFPGQYVSLNVSRKIRDAVIDGQEADLEKLFFESSKISRADLLEKGIAIFDSSMSGKIPRSIVFALSQGMTDQEQVDFFTKVSVRNINSKSRFASTPLSLRKWLTRMTSPEGVIDRESFRSMITQPLVKVPTFSLSLPTSVRDYLSSPHNLFEHRFKFLTSGVELSPTGIQSPTPSELWEKAGSFLGLYSEIAVQTLAEGGTFMAPVHDTRTIEDRMAEVDRVFQKGGAQALRTWQYRPPGESTLALFETMVERREASSNAIEQIEVGGRVFNIQGRLGEGMNVVVYLTDDNKALKVLKKPEAARKVLLQHWMQPLLSDAKIPIAKIIETHPLGLYSLQEYYPGLSLEARFSSFADAETIPEDLNNEILEIWKRSQVLIENQGLWLDFRSANFQLDAEGKPVFVDFNPRFNKGYWRYYLDANGGKFLDTSSFFDTFYNYNLSKPNKLPSRPDDCILLLQ